MYYYLTYKQVYGAASRVARFIKEKSYPIKRLVAISRGGLLPACLLAQFLNIREIHSLALYSYRDDGTQGDITVLVKPNVADEVETLFVDDLVDGGKTARWIKQNYPNVSFVSLFAKRKIDDFLVPPVLVPQDACIVFPWEKMPDKSK